MNKSKNWKFTTFALVCSILIAGAFVAQQVLPYGVKWRTQVIFLKLTGEIRDIDWSEMIPMLKPNSGFYLAPLAQSRNPFAVIVNPHDSEEDIQQGSLIFRKNCVVCHGKGTQSATAPDFTKGTFTHGITDWALYRNITRGIPGTAMTRKELSEDETWQVISYIRALKAEAGSNDRQVLKEKEIDTSPVTYSRILNARSTPEDWLTYSGSYDGKRFSLLSSINQSNVENLKLKWILQLPTDSFVNETSPIVNDGIMYVTEQPNNVIAINAETGKQIWKFNHVLLPNLNLAYGAVNRGLAPLGDMVFMGTLDAHLIALNAKTGKLKWKAEVTDYTDGYSITSAPLAVKNMIIIGVSGGEFGIRGFLDAYDAQTGERIWRFYTIPGEGEPGNDTWAGDSWKTGGAPTWITGSYDPKLNLLYWGVGNPGPDYQGSKRKGDNLYSNSVVALDVDSGKLKWHFQFTPHDTHDWDSNQVPILVDTDWNGKPRQLLLTANRNGFFYALDRETGEFLQATQYVKQDWTSGINSDGRPVSIASSEPSPAGTLVYPGIGGTNWWSPSYSPETERFYISTVRQAKIFFSDPEHELEDRKGNELFLGGSSEWVSSPTDYIAVKAIEPHTGKIDWEFKMHTSESEGHLKGILSTASNLLFVGTGHKFYALDALTGKVLWQVNTGALINANPVTYMVDGKQYVTIASGRAILTFTL